MEKTYQNLLSYSLFLLVKFGKFKLEINRNDHYLLWKWHHINLMCMVEEGGMGKADFFRVN